MACAIKACILASVELELVLNTTDKGYSVIITMPNKMSLVRLVHRKLLCSSQIRYRRRKLRSVHWVPKLSVHLPKPHGILQKASMVEPIALLQEVSWLNSLTIAGVAQKLLREIPDAIILDQYRNVCIDSPYWSSYD
jgi:hypothetical protein